MAYLTTMSTMPDEVKKRLGCNLLHDKAPTLTGKKKWNKYLKKHTWEILYVCKECQKHESVDKH